MPINEYFCTIVVLQHHATPSVHVTPSVHGTPMTCPPCTEEGKRGISILVKASEVHRSHDLISALRHQHRANVHVQPKFEGAGFLLSTSLAVTRISFG